MAIALVSDSQIHQMKEVTAYFAEVKLGDKEGPWHAFWAQKGTNTDFEDACEIKEIKHRIEETMTIYRNQTIGIYHAQGQKDGKPALPRGGLYGDRYCEIAEFQKNHPKDLSSDSLNDENDDDDADNSESFNVAVYVMDLRRGSKHQVIKLCRFVHGAYGGKLPTPVRFLKQMPLGKLGFEPTRDKVRDVKLW
ncbi:unnamed protein product [Prorocentrum cordatum]|uniref:Gamma-glutamylcyclotransferase n=1 Tax=Prorocentrum cordatum TaxID=2364126 RepID=A0ABN9THQ7_9DINO|nr:unnamed protein product [Polarella glacialis]